MCVHIAKFHRFGFHFPYIVNITRFSNPQVPIIQLISV